MDTKRYPYSSSRPANVLRSHVRQESKMKSAHPERGIKGQKKAAEHHVKIDWSKIWEGGGGAEQ